MFDMIILKTSESNRNSTQPMSFIIIEKQYNMVIIRISHHPPTVADPGGGGGRQQARALLKLDKLCFYKIPLFNQNA